MEWLLGEEDVCSVELENWLVEAITFDLIVGSHLNIYRGF